MTLSPTELAHRLDRIAELSLDQVTTDDQAIELAAALRREASQRKAGRWQPYPWQHPHEHDADFAGVCTPACYDRPRVKIQIQGTWLQLGGRGTGKTEGAARYVNDHVEAGPCDTRLPGGHRIVMIAPTQGDAVEAIEGPSGLRVVNPATKVVAGNRGLHVRWTSGKGAGTRMRLLGAHTPDDVERLRAAGNTCLIWLEEAAAMRHLAIALEQSSLGLRLGPCPHFVASTTPKPRPEIKALLESPRVVVTKGRTQDAIHLDGELRDYFMSKYGGTRLGRQELDAELLSDVEGALWVHDSRPGAVPDRDPEDDRPGIEDDRVGIADVGWESHDPNAPTTVARQRVHRCVVSVDPSGGGHGDEAGIGVIGSIGNHGYVLADLSGKMTSDRWARRAVQAYYDYGAEGIVLDKYGGDNPALVVRSIELADGRKGSDVPIFYVPTKVGKRLRAEPVVALYQQHRVHHVGVFPQLEEQQTTWIPDEKPGESPDRVDMLVQGLTYLLVRSAEGTASTAVHRTISRPRRRA